MAKEIETPVREQLKGKAGSSESAGKKGSIESPTLVGSKGKEGH